MTIKEINAERTKQRKLLEDKQEAQQSYLQAHERIMQGLKVDEQELHDDLVKRIKRHFKGITPHIGVSNSGILISYNNIGWLTYKYGETTFEGITKKLSNTIIAEYEEVYGEIEKDTYIGYATATCGSLNMFTGGIENTRY